MSAQQPYLDELVGVQVSNQLHRQWIEYALTFSRDEALTIARYGLTHQARALRSMIREAMSSVENGDGRVHVKLEILVQAAEKSCDTIRARDKERKSQPTPEDEPEEAERDWRPDLV